MTLKLATLYKADNNNGTRIWRIEVDGDKYRVVSGLIDGQHTESGWKVAEPKNVGKANATTGNEQALKEAEALYKKKREQGGYFDNVEDIFNETFFAPMLAHTYIDKKTMQVDKHIKKLLDDAFARGIKVFSQPKLDGIRSATKKTGLFSRNGKEHVSSPHILAALQDVFDLNIRGFVLDGELYNHELHEDFNKVQSLATQKKPTQADLDESEKMVQFHIYDCFDPDHEDYTFSERLAYLNYLRDSRLLPHCIQFVRTDEVSSYEDIDRLQSEYLEENYEGQIIRIDLPYENKRTRALIKRKEFFDEEYEIIELQEGTGNWAGMCKKVLYWLNEDHSSTRPDNTFKAGIRGNQATLKKMLAEKDKYVGSEGTVRYPNLTPDGKPRFGVTIRVYEGKREDAE